MSLLDLPLELFIDILSHALFLHPKPADVLCVAHAFRVHGERVLHTNLRFRTVRQLALFGASQKVNGESSSNVFLLLASVLRRCRAACDNLAEVQAPGDKVPLNVLQLCLHSHMRTNVQHIYDALVLADPREFTWIGPDPPHHFSTAIVPAATNQLFLAISTWPNIVRLKLANLSFPSDPLCTGSRTLGPPLTSITPLLPALPTLRSLALGQATLLPPGAIAAMLCPYLHGQEGMDALEEVCLVDAYSESIWGPRIRRRDIERAAAALVRGLSLDEDTAKHAEAEVLSRIRRIVRCEALTERLMGGDRVEGTTVLD